MPRVSRSSPSPSSRRAAREGGRHPADDLRPRRGVLGEQGFEEARYRLRSAGPVRQRRERLGRHRGHQFPGERPDPGTVLGRVGELVEPFIQSEHGRIGGDGPEYGVELLAHGARGVQQAQVLAVERGGRRGRRGRPGEQLRERGRDGPGFLGRGGEQYGEAPPALGQFGLPAGEVGVEVGQYFGRLAPRVVGEHVAHLVEAQPQLGQPAYPGQPDGVAHAVGAIPSPGYRWEVPPGRRSGSGSRPTWW